MSTILNKIVEHETGVTMLNNIVENTEQCSMLAAKCCLIMFSSPLQQLVFCIVQSGTCTSVKVIADLEIRCHKSEFALLVQVMTCPVISL